MAIVEVLRQVRAMGLLLAFLLMSCSKPSGEASTTSSNALSPGGRSIKLIGSGASFPAPLYDRWFKEFTKKDGQIVVDYQSVGSGQGVKSFIAGQTDFGASDAAMDDREIAEAGGNVVLLPVTAGAVVLAYNIEGLTELKLTRQVYVEIFLGSVKKWNDPKIAAVNPGVALPDLDIAVVHRSDGSGTTFVFTQHLAALSDAWKSGPGVNKSVEWPTGVGAKGNEGVSAQVKQTPGAIGYVEYAYAVLSKQPMATLENKAGKFVRPTLESAAASLATAALPSDLRAWIVDPDGDGSYPIVSYTWILAKKKYDDPEKAKALKKVLAWSLTEGQRLSSSLNYVPLPEPVVAKVTDALSQVN